MTFLAPWALAVGALSAVGALVLHLVARQRPAAFVLPTTRFIPDQRTLVSRVATRPRDLLLLALRMLLLLAAGAAFARPVLTPARGAIAHVVLLDRSRAVANAAAARARALVGSGSPVVIIAFDSMPTTLAPAAWDSVTASPRTGAPGSLSAALVAARRAGAALAQRADSVQLHLVSPVAASELDAATARARAAWPGAIQVERVAMRTDSTTSWRLEQALPASDPLAPSLPAPETALSQRTVRLVRTFPSAADSAVARAGGTIVRWDTASTARVAAEGLALGDDVVVAALGRASLPPAGRVLARWADATPAAVEQRVGTGCLRDVGVRMPGAGDLALHPPFQRIVRGLLAPCGMVSPEVAASDADVAMIAGATHAVAAGDVLRAGVAQPSPLAPWLLALAIALAVAELAVRGSAREEA